MAVAQLKPHLTVVEDPLTGFDGELTAENMTMLAERVQRLDEEKRGLALELTVSKQHEKQLERDVKGKRLRIAELEADREEKALAAPERPQVEAIHACWKAGTGRRTPLHFTDRERIGAAVKRLGFATCLRAIAGIAYDPRRSDPMRNGKVETYNRLELVFRNFGKVESFAERAPAGWEPRAERIAAAAGVEVDQVREWLGEGSE